MATKADQFIGKAPRNYFHIIPNMADDDLDPYQYRLLGHYVRVAGDSGGCWQSTKTTALCCKMSVGKVASTRRELQALGYISIEERDNDTLYIEILDRWAENIARYMTRSPDEHPVHQMNATVHDMNQRRTSQEEPPKNPAAGDERPNIFRVWETETGTMLTQGIVERLKEAAEKYGEDWVRDAIKTAVDNNARTWAYIKTVLERWQRDGRDAPKTKTAAPASPAPVPPVFVAPKPEVTNTMTPEQRREELQKAREALSKGTQS